MDNTEPHEIQQKILQRLGYGKPQSFSALQEDVPSNKFSFHLDRLQEKGLIEKTGNGYTLTARGTEILPHLSTDSIAWPITVVSLCLQADDTVYLEREDAEPLDPTAGILRFPSTRAEKGHAIVEQGERMYSERFSDKSPELRLRAVIESTIRFENGAEQDYLVFCVGAQVDGGEDWYETEEPGSGEILPGTGDIVERLGESDAVLHGVWELRRTESGMELDRLEFLGDG